MAMAFASGVRMRIGKIIAVDGLTLLAGFDET